MFRKLSIQAAALGRASAAVLPSLLRDIAGLIAVALICYGAWLTYPPAGFIVGGVLLLAGVMLLSRKAG